MRISFRVDGLPLPKGNKTSFVIGKETRVDQRGKWVLNPRAVLVEGRKAKDPTKGSEGFETWALNVHTAALVARALNKWEYVEMGAFQIDAWFFLPRPASLPKSVLYPNRKPDLEKLLRTIMDEMESVLYDNDSRFIDESIHKRFADEDHPIGAEITIYRVG